ncbi:MAG: PEP-utilizing enzyme [Negativicutes bacterium]|nr:PEP-utilizing enzyme [Negativicutes bacterium]
MEANKQNGAKLWDAIPGFDFDDKIDLPELNSLFLDATHSFPTLTPMYAWFWIRNCPHGSLYASEILSTPRNKGFVMRDVEGGTYIGMRIIRDEKEIEERTVKFKKAMVPWIEDFDGIWAKQRQELLDLYDKLKACDLNTASNVELVHHLWDMISVNRRMWEIHFQGMTVSYTAFLLLEELVKPYGLTSQSPEFQNLFVGYDNMVFQVDKKLADIAKLAKVKGIDHLILDSPVKEVFDNLGKSAAGKEWLDDLHRFLDIDGWRMVRMNDFDEPYWLEDPTTVLSPIKAFLKKGGNYDLDQKRKELALAREKAIESLLQKAPSERRRHFTALIDLAGKAGSYSEEHDLYCELHCHAVLRRGLLGIGRRLAAAGTINVAEDVLFLNPDEVERVLGAPEFHKIQYIADRRRKRWEEIRMKAAPPVFTTRSSLEEAVGMDLMPSADPIIIKIVVGELPKVREELKADIYGVCGAPGVAEGPARVIMSYSDLDQVEEGDVLVCPGTNPAWTPVFSLVKAVVSDRGGTLSHTAIVAREYGIPTLVNTFTATATIKTGQRLRVDATEGALYILDK